MTTLTVYMSTIKPEGHLKTEKSYDLEQLPCGLHMHI